MRPLTTIAALAGLAVIIPTQALDFDFSGTFTKDNDIAKFNFTVGGVGPSTVKVFSSSWLYANAGVGQPLGGFDPILAIWKADGTLMAQQDDGGVAGTTDSNGTSYSHGVWDSYYSVSLAPGNYIATVGQFDNFAVGTQLSQGFRYDGNDNFTFDGGYGGATQPYFNGVWDSNDPRTGNYAFHLLNVGAATHEPPRLPDTGSSLAMLVAVVGGLAGLRRLPKE
ncbi:MAG: DVUA0089 family protein [Verrucomicrobiales bacterium]|nr:DVUA0089 family protein [Verrucomicrobiales bacterium]